MRCSTWIPVMHLDSGLAKGHYQEGTCWEIKRSWIVTPVPKGGWKEGDEVEYEWARCPEEPAARYRATVCEYEKTGSRKNGENQFSKHSNNEHLFYDAYDPDESDEGSDSSDNSSIGDVPVEADSMEVTKQLPSTSSERRAVKMAPKDLAEAFFCLPSRTSRIKKSRKQSGILESDDDEESNADDSEHTFDAKSVELADLYPLLMDDLKKPSRVAQRLLQRLHSKFDTWLLYLVHDFNLVLFGYGSKMELVNDFVNQKLVNFNHLVVNGFNPSASVKQIVQSLLENEVDANFKRGMDLSEHLDAVTQHFQTADAAEVFIVLHNIDGPNFRNDIAQSALSVLSRLPKIHLIATIDHVNAPLIWSHDQSARFNWLWMDSTTFQPYTQELMCQRTGFLHSGAGASADRHSLASLRSIWASLAENARKMFALMVEDLASNYDGNSHKGITFTDLYRLCRESFLVSSEAALRAQLVEYRDHRLVVDKRGSDGTEYLVVNIPRDLLQSFMQEQGFEDLRLI